MGTYKTPDVYVEEISVFPPSVAEVGTAIPAFIGYTEKARKIADNDLYLKPTKVYSLVEYEAFFGGPRADEIQVALQEKKDSQGKVMGYDAKADVNDPSYLLYHAVKMYFDNGGAQCYIVCVGGYTATPSWDEATLRKGLDAVALEDEPTLIIIPEAVKLGGDKYADLVKAVLLQCGNLGDRFGIFDIHDGADTLDSGKQSTNRGYFGTQNLKYGAAYYPFVKSTINPYLKEGENSSNVRVTIGAAPAVDLVVLKKGKDAVPAVPEVPAVPGTGGDPGTPAVPAVPAVPAIPINTAAYNAAKAELGLHFLNMPPSGAVAGVYAATDKARGVWKAPANVALAGVIEPVVKLTNLMQEDFNVDTNGGKSINALRAFAGKGTLVWGARTLAGNDNEWRYVSVRRFFNMAEESIKKSTYWAVFEPNDANTWVKVRGMIENYLTDKWRDGALAGASPKDAFFVKCGLGSTMNAQDILEGRLNVEVGMAVVRPAEFIVLKFSHKLQTS